VRAGHGSRVLLMTPLTIQVFVAPLVQCGTGPTWQTVVGFLREHLKRRFGDTVTVEQIEMFTPRSFEFADVLAALEGGKNLPIVRVDDRIVSCGEKLSESRIAAAVLESTSPATAAPRSH
jgi:hypothetical protein